jgi:hypothetical protein
VSAIAHSKSTLAPYLFPKGDSLMCSSFHASVAILIVAPAINVLGSETEALKFVQELGGKVQRDDKAGKSVIRVDLAGTAVADRGLKQLATLQHLKELILDNTAVTDVGLKDVAKIKQLQTLSLNGCRVTDEGAKEFLNLQRLDRLRLGKTKLTDKGLKTLAELKHLQALNLECTSITDARVSCS